MALALAGAAALKPEIGLAQALHNYEAILTNEEKIQLRSQGCQLRTMPSTSQP